MTDSRWVRFEVKYFMPLFRCGCGNVFRRFVALQLDQKCFSRRQSVQGQTRPDERHRADLGCNIEFPGGILHLRHDLCF